MFVHPDFDPVILHIAGPIAIRWYGLSYLLGFFGAYLLGSSRITDNMPFSQSVFSDLIFYVMLGVILGGRLGYILFYSPMLILHDPLKILYIWQGGMSFHGGLLGVMLSVVYFCYKFKLHFLDVADFIVPLVPIALCTGRCANFINAELYGRVTDVPWAMIFPNVDTLPRHPSQLYEMFAEGILLFIILNYLGYKHYLRGFNTGMFLLFYSIFRIFLELFRQPDVGLGFILAESITMGQLLSVPMFVLGCFFILNARDIDSNYDV